MSNYFRIHRKNHIFIKRSSIIIMLLVMIIVLASCDKPEPDPVIVIEDYLVLVDDETVQKDEVMIYVYQIVEEFESIGGENVWEFEDFSNGKSAIEVAKDAVLENIVRIKILNKKANEQKLTIPEDQVNMAKEQAEIFFNVMDGNFKIINSITLELVEKVFLESAIAKEVSLYYTTDFKPDENLVLERMLENEDYKKVISLDVSDILTQITVGHIFISVREMDQEGNYVTLTDEEKSRKLVLAEQVHIMALDGEDFTGLMEEYSDESQGVYTFSKALLPENFKDGLITLSEGEISDILESDAGYHIFKVDGITLPEEEAINAFKVEFENFEQELRNSIISDLREDAFNAFYDEWKNTTKVLRDLSSWENISLQIN